jgi:hypothetical protein
MAEAALLDESMLSTASAFLSGDEDLEPAAVDTPVAAGGAQPPPTTGEVALADGAPVVVKRKRGRPRKNPDAPPKPPKLPKPPKVEKPKLDMAYICGLCLEDVCVARGGGHERAILGVP